MQKLFSLLLMAFLFVLPAKAGPSGGIIEWAPFTIKEDTTHEQLLQASERLQTHFLNKQKGFIKRELLHEGGRKWVDIIYWASEDDAKKAISVAMTSEACGAFFGLMEEADINNPGAGIKHLSRVNSWSSNNSEEN